MKGKCTMPSYKKYQTQKGTKWKFQLFIGRDQHGKQIIKTRAGFDTKKEASTAAAALEKQLHNESLLDNAKLTFKQVYEIWLDSYKLTVKPSTLRGTTSRIETHIMPGFGDKLLKDITTTQCQKAVQSWFNKPVQNYHEIFNTLVNILDYAVQMKFLLSNPALAVVVPNKKQQKKLDLRYNDPTNPRKAKENYYTKQELKQFLECAKTFDNKQYYPLFRTLAFTGARSGEICALTWSDIDFLNNTITINKTRATTSQGLCIQSPKTKNSNRVIYIDQTTKQVLKQWQLDQRKKMLMLGFNTLQADQLVFANTKNKLLQPSTVSHDLTRIAEKAGVKVISPHGMRHTYATLAQNNMSPKELQTQLGHSNIQTTLNIYTSVTDQQLESIPDKFTAFVNF